MNSSNDGLSISSCTVAIISPRHIGQYCNWLAQFVQNPLYNQNVCLYCHCYVMEMKKTHLCLHGSILIVPFMSKHSVHESSRTLSLRSCSKNKCLGRTILSWGFNTACSLKLSKLRFFGGNLNGSEPKLNRHCWNDMNDAAAKKPSLEIEFNNYIWHIQLREAITHRALPNTCFKTPPSIPSKLKITSRASKSSKQPRIDPPVHIGKSCEMDFALCHIKRLHPSNEIEYWSSPIP